jgi:hypothetical protein
MATVQQIIEFAELIYPRVKDIASSDKLILLNQIQDEIKNKLLRIKWEQEPIVSSTIADQKTYTLPTGCHPYNMVKLLIADSLGSEVFNEYTYVGIKDNKDISEGYYYSFITDELAVIARDGKAISESGLDIRWFFYKDPTPLTSTTQIPDVDAQYHNLLKYGLIQMVSSMGDNPEPTVANYWQAKFDEELNSSLRDLQDKFNVAPLSDIQAKEYW